MKRYRTQRLIRDGNLVAEVEIELEDDDRAWGPTLSKEDAFKLDDVREAMRSKNYRAVNKVGKLYRLSPLNDRDLQGIDAA